MIPGRYHIKIHRIKIKRDIRIKQGITHWNGKNGNAKISQKYVDIYKWKIKPARCE
jgi:hypothetical protein